MSYRFFAGLMALSLVHAGHVTAQLRPTAASAGLLPTASSVTAALAVPSGTPTALRARAGGGAGGFLTDAIVFSAASFGGVWAGAQVPFDPADDDSDFSVWHLLTAPAASVAAVTVAAAVRGHGVPSSLHASLVGAGAGLVVGLVTSMSAGDDEVLLSYAVVHGVVTALKAR